MREVVQAGWIQTTTNPSDVALVNGQVVNGVNFGNFELVTINAEKFNDLDGDHTQDVGEPKLQNWTIRLDKQSDANAPICTGGVVNGEFCEKVTNASGNVSFTGLGPGTYIVSEVLQGGWIQTRPNASFGGLGAQADGTYILTIASGVNPTEREFGNFQLGSITIVKNTVGGNDTFTYNATGNTLPPSFQITTASNTGSHPAFTGLTAGTYTFSEQSLAGWAPTNLVCTVGGTANPNNVDASVLITSGANVTCTFTNNKPAAQIDIDPPSAFNEIGDNHVVTATVQVHNGDGSYVNAPNGTLVTFSLVNNTASADFVPAVGGDTCTTSAGQCSVTINATQTGGVDVHASSDPVELGVTVHVETDGTGDNSADASKTWVDAKIEITPETDTNPIHTAHVFTVTVTQYPDGATPAATANVTTNVTPTPDLTDTTTCGPAVPFVGDAATCTITINSSVPAVFTATASATMTVGGVVLTRATDGSANNSGSAEKTYEAGALKITKVIAGLDNVVNASSIDDSFTVTVTGPSYPGGTAIVFTLTNGVLEAPTTVTLDPIIPGDYTVTESDAGPEWSEVVATSPVAVVASEPASEVTVTNTYVPGSLEVTKVLQLNNYLLPNLVDLDFTINVTGPSYPAGTTLTFNVVDGVVSGPQTLSNLIPGAYAVAETGVDTVAWTVTGGGGVTVNPGTPAAQSSVANSLKIPSTQIAMTPDVFETTPGGNVILTITDTNNGEVPISSPSVQLLANAVPTAPQPTFVSESGVVNGILDVGETWTWTWTGSISVETVFTANGIGTDPLGNPVNGPTYPTETLSLTIEVFGATRTLGFWQTHTSFTNHVYNSFLASTSTSPLFVGVPSWPTTGSHKGIITATSTPFASQLFGGFYAPIAKKTDGTKRQPVDQARITLLQQLLAAKLNCAAFGCSAATETLIAGADTAYASGTKASIMSYVSLLDIFNNSGDDIAIPPTLPPTGKATPKDSQAIANTAFWNTP